jgi:hypothetical protein
MAEMGGDVVGVIMRALGNVSATCIVIQDRVQYIKQCDTDC